jgi:hypothetical protein
VPARLERRFISGSSNTPKKNGQTLPSPDGRSRQSASRKYSPVQWCCSMRSRTSCPANGLWMRLSPSMSCAVSAIMVLANTVERPVMQSRGPEK